MKTHTFLNLYYLLSMLWRRRYVIILPMLILPFLSSVIGAIIPKKYHSHTTLLLQETSKLNPFLADFSVSTQLQERMAALQALLHSRHMLTEVAVDMNLLSEGEQTPDSRILNQLSSALRVELIGNDLIKIHLTQPDPARMAETLNVVSHHFVDNLLAPERSSIDASESFLKEQLQKQQQALRASELALAEFKRTHAGILPDQHKFNTEQLRDLKKSLTEKETLLAGASASLESLKTQLLKTNPILSSIEHQIVQITSELNQLLARYTDRHSRVIRARAKLRQLQAERADVLAVTDTLKVRDFDQLWQLATRMNVDSDALTAAADKIQPLLVSQLEAVEGAKSRENQLSFEIAQIREQIAGLQTQVNQFADIEQQLTELMRDIATKKQVYDDLLKRHEMAKVTGSLGKFEQNDRIKVIDKPFTPGAPSNLPLFVFFIAGIFGGMALGLGIALILEVLNTAVYRRDTAETYLGVPVISRLPDFRRLMQPQTAPLRPVSGEYQGEKP